MTLLFVENRYKTYFFDAIALELEKQGHVIHFLVQNKSFLPNKKFTNHIMAYPKPFKNDLQKIDEVEKVISSDRQQNHFNKKDTSYFYCYNSKIKTILEKVKPDFVFGESTAFHELLTINNCRDLGVLYLNPSTCRYPLGRFSFYKYDTLEPYKGSHELLSDEAALTVINQIVYRTAKPDYMKAVKVTKAQKITDKVKLVGSYLLGERFNTPNPIVKRKTEKQKSINISNWDKNAVSQLNTNSFNILYPLQMQPEANIDVWGRSYRNQTELIKELANALPNDVCLYIKPNPKSKYELTQELIDFALSNKNVITLHHTTKMDDVLPEIDLVVTVTGTIAIECILSNKPVLNLVETINNTANNCQLLTSIKEELPEQITKVKNGVFPKLDDEGHIAFINQLNKTSYKGVIADPFNDANCVSKNNISAILAAFNDVTS